MSGGASNSTGWNGTASTGFAPMQGGQVPMGNPGGAYQQLGAHTGVGSSTNSPMNQNQFMPSGPSNGFGGSQMGGLISASPGVLQTSAGGGQTPLTPGGNTWGGNQGPQAPYQFQPLPQFASGPPTNTNIGYNGPAITGAGQINMPKPSMLQGLGGMMGK